MFCCCWNKSDKPLEYVEARKLAETQAMKCEGVNSNTLGYRLNEKDYEFIFIYKKDNNKFQRIVVTEKRRVIIISKFGTKKALNNYFLSKRIL